jgi:uncharacterized protein (DUF4213/DUF364 family)
MTYRPALHALLDWIRPYADAVILDAQIGPFWTAVLSRRCGLASTPHLSHADALLHPPSLRREELIGRPVWEVAQWVLGDEPVRAGAGLAAINSVIEPDLSHCRQMNAKDLLIQRALGHRVAIVGHFPFTDEVRAAAGELWVLELNPRPGDLPAHMAPQVIPQADVVAITGVTLINHTFDDLVRLCRPDAYVIVLGGSTPLCPALFDYGVDVLGGTVVDDPELVLKDIAGGATFRELRGKRPVLMFQEPPD